MIDHKLIILAIYFSILLGIGFFASKRITNISDYYVGGKKLGYWIAALSARSTGESGWLLIGVTGMGALIGVSAFWIVVGEVLGVFISWQFMAKKFKRLTDEYNSITIPDFLVSHFRSSTNTIRIIAAAALSIIVVIYVSAQIDVTGKTFESFLGFNYYTGIAIGFGIVAPDYPRFDRPRRPQAGQHCLYLSGLMMNIGCFPDLLGMFPRLYKDLVCYCSRISRYRTKLRD